MKIANSRTKIQLVKTTKTSTITKTVTTTVKKVYPASKKGQGKYAAQNARPLDNGSHWMPRGSDYTNDK